MTAEQQLDYAHSAFDTVNNWLQGEGANVKGIDRQAGLVADARDVASRVQRLRACGGRYQGVELSVYSANLAKMVGAAELLVAPEKDQE